MARGSEIIVSSDPRGVEIEGIISGTPKPGTVMQMQAGTALVGTRFTWEVYAPGTDGQRRIIAILLPDRLQGGLSTTAYVTGTRGFLYIPQAGEEFNMLVADIAGTADDHAIGDLFIIKSGVGKLIANTGSPESIPFQCLEAAVDPVADALLWCRYTGY